MVVMTTETDDDIMVCAGCGASLAPGLDRVYPLGVEDVLCMECSQLRGGVYLEEEDRWTVAPRVDDLMERLEEAAR